MVANCAAGKPPVATDRLCAACSLRVHGPSE